jgi:hypothetical protein
LPADHLLHEVATNEEIPVKYYVTFQQMGQNGRPIDHPSTADFGTDGAGMLPNVGDYVTIMPVGNSDAPSYEGKVASRLFRYLGENSCGVNIVVADTEDDWGKLIKE